MRIKVFLFPRGSDMQAHDFFFLLRENYIAFLMLGGLVVIMFVYHNVHLPASGAFYLIAAVLFVMCLANSFERWATLSPDRHSVRLAASVIHYVLQPLVIYLEVAVLLSPLHRMRHLILSALPLVANAVIYLFAPLAGKLVFWYDGNYHFRRGPLGPVIYFVTLFYLALLLVLSVRFFRENEKKMSVILLFMAVIAIVTALLEALNVVPGFIDEAFVFGAFLFHMYLITVYENQIETNLANKELELSKSRIDLLRQQIKPHFVFNSLSIIKSLIRRDPPTAVQRLEDFSEYLRANLDAISSEDLVPFEDELANIEAYVSLALADDSKKIEMVYNIEERGFRLPPLSVEPFVENAIKHGIVHGGTVTLSATSDSDYFIITVSDNGKGFDPGGTAQEKKRRGIGMSNARTRLARMCDGIMDIKSGGTGTDVIIRLPKKRTEEGAQ